MIFIKKPNNRKSEEYVKQCFEEKGCTMLESYINCKNPIKYICHCGHENTISFEKFMKQKHGCKHCTKIGGYTHEEVSKYFLDSGCELLDTYVGVKNKMKYKCSCGNVSYTTFDSFKKGSRCYECGLKKYSSSSRTDINEVREYFINNNCVPLFESYRNDKDKLKYQCECGNISYIRFGDFKKGKRCNNCRVERINKTKHKCGICPTSLQQNYIHSLIGGILNYPLNNNCLDIAFPEHKIYVEYDGSGHDLSVKFGTLTEEQFKEKEKRRNYALYRQGWKSIRIKSKKDNLPSEENILKMFNHGVDLLKENSWIVFDIDNSEIEYKNNKINYNFGEIKRLRNDQVS